MGAGLDAGRGGAGRLVGRAELGGDAYDDDCADDAPKKVGREMTRQRAGAGNPSWLCGDRKAQVLAAVVMAAAALDVAVGVVVWAVLHCLFGAGTGGE